MKIFQKHYFVYNNCIGHINAMDTETIERYKYIIREMKTVIIVSSRNSYAEFEIVTKVIYRLRDIISIVMALNSASFITY